jgi:hypothetical protein
MVFPAQALDRSAIAAAMRIDPLRRVDLAEIARRIAFVVGSLPSISAAAAGLPRRASARATCSSDA